MMQTLPLKSQTSELLPGVSKAREISEHNSIVLYSAVWVSKHDLFVPSKFCRSMQAGHQCHEAL